MSNMYNIVSEIMTKLTQKFAQNNNLKMFLFNKRTRNIIKYMWGFFATLIILTMIIAYSGFATLARPQPEQIEIPEEVRQQLRLQQEGNATGDNPTATEEEVLRAIEEGNIDLGTESSQSNDTTETNEEGSEAESTTQTSQEFKLEI